MDEVQLHEVATRFWLTKVDNMDVFKWFL